MSIIKHS